MICPSPETKKDKKWEYAYNRLGSKYALELYSELGGVLPTSKQVDDFHTKNITLSDKIDDALRSFTGITKEQAKTREINLLAQEIKAGALKNVQKNSSGTITGYKYFDRVVNYDKVFTPEQLNDLKLRHKIAVELVEKRKKFETASFTSLVNYFRLKDPDLVTNPETKEILNTPGGVNELIRVMPDDAVIEFKELGTAMDGKYKAITDLFSKDDFNPLILMRTRNGKTFFSIHDITTKSLTKSLTDMTNEPLSVFSDRSEFIHSNAKLGRTESGLRSAKVLTLAMMLANADKNVTIQNLSVTQITNANIRQHNLSMYDNLAEMKAILNNSNALVHLSPEIKAILSLKGMFEKDSYIGGEIDRLRAFYYSLIQKLKVSDKKSDVAFSSLLGKDLEEMDKLFGSYLVNNEDLMTVINERMKSIARFHGYKEELYTKDPLMIELSNAYYYLDNSGKSYENTVKDMNLFETNVGNNIMVTFQPVQMYLRNMQSALLNANQDIHKSFIKPFNEKFNEMQKAKGKIINKFTNIDFVNDTGFQDFSQLFRTVEGLDSNLKKTRINMMEIHFDFGNDPNVLGDRNSPGVAELVKNGTLLKEDIELGNFVVKTIQDVFIASYMEQHKGTNTEKLLLEEAKKSYLNNWVNGRLAITHKKATEVPKGSSIKTRAKSVLKDALSYSHSSEITEFAKNDYAKHNQIVNMYESQFGNDPTFGSETRRRQMGLSVDGNGEIYIANKNNYDNMELNIQSSMNYFINAFKYKTAIDRAIPAYYAAQTVTRHLDSLNGEPKYINAYNYLKEHFSFIIQNNRKLLHKGVFFTLDGQDVNLDDILAAVNTVAGLAITVGNTNMPINNVLRNLSKVFSIAYSHDLAGSKDFASLANLGDAAKLLLSEPEKYSAIVDHYLMGQVDMRSLLNSIRFNDSKKALESYHTQFANFVGDYTLLATWFLGNMIKDGSLDAHSYDKKTKKVTYDLTKDERNKTEEGKMIIQKSANLYEKLDPNHNYAFDSKGKVQFAYDDFGLLRLKQYAQQRIIGPYDPTNKVGIENNILGKLFIKLHKFVPSAFQDAMYSTSGELQQTGAYKLEEITTETGETAQILGRENRDHEAKMVSMLGSAKVILTDGYAKFKEHLNDPKLGMVRKENLWQLMIDMSVYSLGFMFTYMVAGGDDDEYQKLKKTKLFYYYTHGFGDIISEINPRDYLKVVNNPLVAFGFLENLYNMSAAMVMLDFSKAGIDARNASPAIRQIRDMLNVDSKDVLNKVK